MNTCRTGSRNRNRNLDRQRNRPLDRYASRLLAGLPRPRRNDLAAACRCLRQVVRLHEKWAREDPETWGPGYWQRQLVQLERERFHREVDAALARVYGPQTPDQ